MDDPSSIAYVILEYILAAGIIFGNSLTLISIFYKKCLQTRMNVFVGHLAFADLIVGLFALPIDSVFYIVKQIENEHLCHVRYALMALSSGMSVICLFFISVDRYIGILHPLRYQVILSNVRIKLLVACIWIITLVSVILPHVTNWTRWRPGLQCEFQLVYKTPYQLYILMLIAIFLLMPCPMYLRIFWEVRKQRKFIEMQVQSTRTRPGPNPKESHRTFRMALVFILFVIFWAPYVIMSIIRQKLHTEEVLVASKWTILLFMANSGVNPIVYGLLSKRFQSAYKEILCYCCKNAERKVTPVAHVNIVLDEP
jgi:hypothetical protein